MPETSASPAIPVPPDAVRAPRSPIRELFREALLDAASVLLPVTCSGCDAPDRALCVACAAELIPTPIETELDTPLEATLETELDTPLEAEIVVSHDTTFEADRARLRVVSALRYEGVPRRVILALKEQGRTDAALPLSRSLSRVIPLAVRGEVELAAVPSSRAAFRRRGFVPVELLLRRAGYSVPRRVLEQTRVSRAQKTLDREERDANLRGSLRARHPLSDRRFVLVDDVLTTGSTLIEATRALRSAGAHVVGAVTLAATPLRHQEGALRHPRALGESGASFRLR